MAAREVSNINFDWWGWREEIRAGGIQGTIGWGVWLKVYISTHVF
jgi:hypothetical protein